MSERNRETSKSEYSSFRVKQSIARLTTFARSLPHARPEALIEHYLLPAINLHNSMTADHMRRVGKFSFQLALAYSHTFPDRAFSAKQLLDIYYAGILHDIGKLEIDNTILNGNGGLSTSEKNHMRFHPTFTWIVLKNIPSLQHLSEMTLSHHEHWNGKGYPQGIKKQNIPLGARIITISDTYDAFTQHRPYFPSVSEHGAYAHIEKNAGILFDPHLMMIFEKGFRF